MSGTKVVSALTDDLIDLSLLDELINSGVKCNVDDVITVIRNSEGKLLWLEKGNNTTGLSHILEKCAEHFARRGISDIPSLLKNISLTKPIKIGRNERGLFANYIFNDNSYRVVYGTNGYIVTFYPID